MSKKNNSKKPKSQSLKDRKRPSPVLHRPLKIKEHKDIQLLLPDIFKSEVNFLIYPFFALSKKGLKNKEKTEYRDTITRNGEKFKISWQVTANSTYHYPTPFDREVHKIVEQIVSRILEDNGEVQNPIRIGSLYSICKRMGINTSGRTKMRIKQSLERIRATSIKSTGAFYSKKAKEWIYEDSFGLYDWVVFRGKRLPTGEMADTNYIYLGNWYLQSLNAFYVKPIDYRYYRSLKSKIASRLYEVLGVRFYGLKNRRQPFVWFKYNKLCQLLPIVPQKHLSDANRYLRPAHDELIQTKFLAKAAWVEYQDRWLITYYPGTRAKEEIQTHRRIPFPELEDAPVRQLPLPSSHQEAQKLVCYFHQKHNRIDRYQPTQKELKQAKQLIEDFGEEKAQYITDHALQKAPETNYRMKYFGAVLGYVDGALKAFDKEQLRKQQEKEERGRLLQKQKLQERKDKRWLANPRFSRDMQGLLTLRIKNFEIKNAHTPTQEEVQQMKKDMIQTKKQILLQKYHFSN